jgi:hypothetical protein
LSAQAIPVKVMLVCQDAVTIDILLRFMGWAAMDVEVCSDAKSATPKLCCSKFEGVAIDFKEKIEAMDLLTKLHGMTSNRGAVVLAILDRGEDVQGAFRSGANFVLQRPIAPKTLIPTLKASYSLMLQERRRSCRFSVRVPVYISTNGSHSEFAATTVNLSQRGMALATSVHLRVGENVRARLTIPGANQSTTVSGDVCWNGNNGMAGIQFTDVPSAANELLQSWLLGRLQKSASEQVLAHT